MSICDEVIINLEKDTAMKDTDKNEQNIGDKFKFQNTVCLFQFGYKGNKVAGG